jgi:DNA-binding transcriptional LysR family regulator
MEIEHLRCFLSVAKLLSFTKAAEEQHIAQPSMSQIISSMEKELGTKLFDRNNRSVRLTPGGRIFYDEALIIVAKFDEAVKKMRGASSGMAGILRVGYWGPYEPILIPKLLASFRRAYPKIELSIRQDNNRALVEAVTNDLIDIVFSSPYPYRDRDDISLRILDSSASCAVVHENHPLADVGKISPEFLNNEKFVLLDMQDPQDNSKLEKDWMRNGLRPGNVTKLSLYENMLLMVEAEIGITLLPRCMEPFTGPNLRYIELEGDMTVEFCVAWSNKNQNPAIRLLLDIIETEGAAAR